MRAKPSSSAAGFTLTEILVAVTVLLILLVLVAQLFNNTTRVTNLSTSHLDADNTARLLFARLSADFTRMVRRADVDRHLKGNADYTATDGSQSDRLAFYCEVPGYAPAGGSTSNTVSLVAYRLNPGDADRHPSVERMSKALSWSGDNQRNPVLFLPLTIADNWPAAVSATAADADYETLAPNIIRFEYCYLLRDGTLGVSVSDLKDLAAIGVTIAVLDRKSATITPPAEARALAAQLRDFNGSDTLGKLEQEWRNAVTASDLPAQKKGGVFIYSRIFYFNNFAN